jgi:hypothetical protein
MSAARELPELLMVFTGGVMKTFWVVIATLGCFVMSVNAQTRQPNSAPVYQVTVVERTIPAINYGHRTIPTQIDFKGTVLLPDSKGKAIVRNERGSTIIDAKFEGLPLPTRFGGQFLTYVLWAITPDGRTANLGEIVVDPSDKGRLHATTEFPAFGLIVTAEPYFSVAQPSDVVVIENKVRPDTIGKIEVVDAKYELFPRGHFVLDEQPSNTPTKKVGMKEYEAITAVYQAQNAVQIAQAQGADRHAPDVLAKAKALLSQAQSYQLEKDFKAAVMTAREASQAAEDARSIAEKRIAAQEKTEPVRLGSVY